MSQAYDDVACVYIGEAIIGLEETTEIYVEAVNGSVDSTRG